MTSIPWHSSSIERRRVNTITQRRENMNYSEWTTERESIILQKSVGWGILRNSVYMEIRGWFLVST